VRTSHLVDVRKWFVVSDQHLSKLRSLLRVYTHDAPQQKYVVRSVADLLGVEDDLLELASLSKTLNHLHTKQSTKTMMQAGGKNVECGSADRNWSTGV